MDLLNLLFAWLSVFLGVFLAAKYLFRKLAQGKGPRSAFFKKWNRESKPLHIWLGVLLIVLGFLHGLFSSTKVFSLNWGTALWLVSILLALSYVLRRQFKKGNTWLFLHRVLTLVFFVLIVVHLVEVGGPRILSQFRQPNLPEQPQWSQDGTNPPSPNLSGSGENQFGATLQDGTYVGTAYAYGPDLTVQVQVSNNQVTSIEILSHNEVGQRYYKPAMEQIPGEIVAQQSLNVDAVSGATYTSVGIMDAVNDALSQAVVDGIINPKHMN